MFELSYITRQIKKLKRKQEKTGGNYEEIIKCIFKFSNGSKP